MKKFRKLASRFSIARGMKEYRGDVLASQEAIFVLVQSGMLGAIETLLTRSPLELAIGTFGKAVTDADGIIQAELSDLPEEITEDPSWPDTYGKTRVFILPRTCVKSMRYPWWGSLEIFTAEDRFNVVPVFFLRHRVLRNLRDLGWPI
jgi:hypothetical protein